LHLSSAEISQITADFSDEREIQQKPQTGSFQEPEYPMKIIWSAITCVALFQISASAQPHEVWLFDQSDTHAGGGGGTLYIYDGAQLHGNNAAAATPEVIDLGGTAQSLALAQTGTVPVRPHMFFFNRSDLYSFSLASFTPVAAPPNTPAPYLVFSRDGFGVADSHGGVLTRGSRYLWVADRAANLMTVVDTSTDLVVNEFSLLSSNSADPAPDLMGISPDGNRAYVTLRGPIPLTGNFAGVNNAVGSTPGLGIIRVTQSGRNGELQAIAPVSHRINGEERADPHGIGVRSKR
jgi:hypothetical protein